MKKFKRSLANLVRKSERMAFFSSGNRDLGPIAVSIERCEPAGRSRSVAGPNPGGQRGLGLATGLTTGFATGLAALSWLAIAPSISVAVPKPMRLTLSTSTGPSGIDADRLHEPPYDLLGRKIGIGQVEIGRPAQLGLDKAVVNNNACLLYTSDAADE